MSEMLMDKRDEVLEYLNETYGPGHWICPTDNDIEYFSKQWKFSKWKLKKEWNALKREIKLAFRSM